MIALPLFTDLICIVFLIKKSNNLIDNGKVKSVRVKHLLSETVACGCGHMFIM